MSCSMKNELKKTENNLLGIHLLRFYFLSPINLFFIEGEISWLASMKLHICFFKRMHLCGLFVLDIGIE